MFILKISLLSAKTYLISHLWLSWSNNLERQRVSSTVWLSRRKKQSLSSCYNVYFKFICDLYSCHKHMQLPVKSFRLSLWLSPWCLYLEKAGFFDKWVYPVKTQYQLIGLHTCSWSFIIFVKEPHGWFSFVLFADVYYLCWSLPGSKLLFFSMIWPTWNMRLQVVPLLLKPFL